MNPLINTLLRQVFTAIKKARPENVVMGQKNHPRLVNREYHPPDYLDTISPHYHKTPEICFCRKGQCAVKLGKYAYLLHPGDFCLINRNVHHFESYDGPDLDYELIWFFFVTANEMAILHSRYVKENYSNKTSLHVTVPRAILQHFDRIDEQEATWNTVRNGLQSIFSLIERQLRQTAGPGRNVLAKKAPSQFQRQKIEKAKQYLKLHFMENMKVETVAQAVGLNPEYLAKLFHAVEGDTVKVHINTLRLQEALRLLNETTLDVSEITFKCGFKDPYYFSRIFKKYAGLSPTQLRNKYRTC
jgi:AraC-like DNA-binding protein